MLGGETLTGRSITYIGMQQEARRDETTSCLSYWSSGGLIIAQTSQLPIQPGVSPIGGASLRRIWTLLRFCWLSSTSIEK